MFRLDLNSTVQSDVASALSVRVANEATQKLLIVQFDICSDPIFPLDRSNLQTNIFVKKFFFRVLQWRVGEE